MVSIKEIATGRSDIYRVPPSALKVKDGWNSRDLHDEANKQHIISLAKSIASEGVKEALTVYQEDGELFIENGHCRYAACILAIGEYGAPADLTVPIRMSDKKATPADRILSQITLNSGKPLSPIEMGSVFKKLKQLDLSNDDIATRCGVTRVYVGQLLSLVDMPEEIVGMVRGGTVSATLAIETVKDHKGDVEAASETLKGALQTAKEQGKERATAKHIKTAKEKPARKPSIKIALKGIFERSSVYTVDPEAETVEVVFSKADYAEFVALTGIDKSMEELERENADIV